MPRALPALRTREPEPKEKIVVVLRSEVLDDGSLGYVRARVSQEEQKLELESSKAVKSSHSELWLLSGSLGWWASAAVTTI